MSNLNSRDVESLKAEGRFYHAGALAAVLGTAGCYGCHYGMRSTRTAAIAEFARGHAEAWFYLVHGPAEILEDDSWCDDGQGPREDYESGRRAECDAND